MGHLQECVIRSPPLVRTQLLECVKEIVAQDYPHPWSSLLQEMVANLQSKDVVRVYGALLMMRTVARRLEFMHDLREILDDFAAAALPVLLPLLQGLLNETSVADELAVMMKTILKTFWSCIYIDVPTVLVKDPALCRGWLEAVLALMKRPVPVEGQAADPRERAQSPWWKLKKWSLSIANRIRDRHSDPRITVSENGRALSQIYRESFATPYLTAVMSMLDSVAKGVWHSPRVLILLTYHLETSVNPSDSYRLLEPYLCDILTQSILPQCYFTEADEEEWRDDPMEVIRKNGTSGAFSAQEFYDPCNAASALIVKVMDSKKCQAKCLDAFMERVMAIAKAFRTAHDANPLAVPAELSRQMNGAVLVIGMLLEDVLTTKRNAKYRDNLEGMIQQYLLPLFASPCGHLRAKACWLASRFASAFAFTLPDGSKGKGQGPLFDELFARVLHCMQDPDLPVQVEAVISFRDFVEALAEAERLMEKLSPILSDLLRHLFHLTSLVEATDIVATLESIVESIGDGIQPFALDVCQQLVGVYYKVVDEKDAPDDAGDLFDATLSISRAIITILDACSSLPDTISQLERLLLPMMEHMCNKTLDEVFDQVCEMLTYFTYFVTPISPAVWAFWPRLHAILKDWGIDFVENITVPLDNFICKGADVFCTSTAPNYRESLFDMVQYCLNGDFSEVEVAPATKLLEIVLLNCKGRVDEWLWPYIELAMTRINTVQEPAFATLLMNIIPTALFYNSQLTLQLLEQHGTTAAVFTMWFKMLQDESKFFRRAHDKKLSCVGLTALLPMHEAALPPLVTAALPQVLAAIVRLLKLLREQEAAKAKDEESDDDEDGDSADADDGGDDYEEVDGDESGDEGAEYLAQLAKTRERRADADIALSRYDDWTDDDEIETALDDVDAYEHLAATLRGVQAASPQRFQELVGSLDAGGKTGLQEIIQFAHLRKSKSTDNTTKSA